MNTLRIKSVSVFPPLRPPNAGLGQHHVRSLSSSSEKVATDVPLIFLHGMKGSHLAFQNSKTTFWGNQAELKRAWLTLPALLNFPPRDHDIERDISLPLTYRNKIQDRGRLAVDGTVDHIVEFGLKRQTGQADSKGQSFLLEQLPFYGHVTKLLHEVEHRYTRNHEALPDDSLHENENHALHVRPARNYAYDWRRSLPELSEEFHAFCQAEFPNKPVQILAHSLGGLIAFGAMRKHPDKYRPGAVFVGVPFGTGIQYLQDLHWGYFTELGRCRQFLPPTQFTFSSHWSFFPMNARELGDTFVDVTHQKESPFVVGESAIGNPGTVFQETISGIPIDVDFYNVSDWEDNEFGVFDPAYKMKLSNTALQAYKDHMNIQLSLARGWRNKTLRDGFSDLPSLVVCSTNAIPTVNQILRRRRNDQDESCCSWEYDYVSGRSVPGDGRIDFDKSFPPNGIPYKEVRLDSMHAKQMCWEQNGGSLGKIWAEVTKQIEDQL